MFLLLLFFLLCDFTVVLLLASLFIGSKFVWNRGRRRCLRGSRLQQAVCSMDFGGEWVRTCYMFWYERSKWTPSDTAYTHTRRKRQSPCAPLTLRFCTLTVCLVRVCVCSFLVYGVFVGWSIDATWPTLGAGTGLLYASCTRVFFPSLLPLLYSSLTVTDWQTWVKWRKRWVWGVKVTSKSLSPSTVTQSSLLRSLSRVSPGIQEQRMSQRILTLLQTLIVWQENRANSKSLAGKSTGIASEEEEEHIEHISHRMRWGEHEVRDVYTEATANTHFNKHSGLGDGKRQMEKIGRREAVAEQIYTESDKNKPGGREERRRDEFSRRWRRMKKWKRWGSRGSQDVDRHFQDLKEKSSTCLYALRLTLTLFCKISLFSPSIMRLFFNSMEISFAWIISLKGGWCNE